jgi:N-acetylglucosamine kinase-like BadF-type ATPase
LFIIYLFFLLIVAVNNNDRASQQLFEEAGYALGAHLRAISTHIGKSLYDQGKLRVVTVGSVFRSWKFLKPGIEIFVKLEIK